MAEAEGQRLDGSFPKKSWEYMDSGEVWDVILTTLTLKPMNELEIYRKWIPRLFEIEKED